MPNVKRGLFRIYITLASAVSIITVIIAVNTVMHINKTASIQIGFFQAEVAGVALVVLLGVWVLPLAGYHVIRWIIRGFRSR
ncbi:hypothetical protein K8S19_12680 [bacterium]|nr:hypothetical protein [bacterium]